MAGKKVGKRALFYGALAQSLPDIDFVASFFLSPAEDLLAHRGITHSFLFLFVAGIVLALTTERIHRPQQVKLSEWIVFYFVEIGLHLALDVCNAYGTGLLEPFSDRRFSLHLLFVADPLYSLWLFIALAGLMIMSSKNPARRKWIFASLAISSVYFAYAITNKLETTSDVKTALEKQRLGYTRILTTPTPLNTWLWFVAAETDSGFHLTHHSVWDNDERPLNFSFVRRRDDLLDPFLKDKDTGHLLKFSQGFYTVEQREDHVIFNDLRFGQAGGWSDPNAPFVFYYYLDDLDANALLIQRGRFANWNRETMTDFVNRIRGQ
jgi:inner membrane protein